MLFTHCSIQRKITVAVVYHGPVVQEESFSLVPAHQATSVRTVQWISNGMHIRRMQLHKSASKTLVSDHMLGNVHSLG